MKHACMSMAVYLPPENFGCASNDSMLDLCYVTENRPYCMLYVQNDGKLSQTKICYKNEIELNFLAAILIMVHVIFNMVVPFFNQLMVALFLPTLMNARCF